MKVLITGAAGNLGSRLSQYLLRDNNIIVRMMTHRRPVPFDVTSYKNAEVCYADLMDPATLSDACAGVDAIVHFAGVLFAPGPEKFLPVTNVVYFKNLVDAAAEQRVKRIILVSFPHVEGHTTPDNPARGSLNGNPVSVHARTRLLEEQYLFEKCSGTSIIPVSLRAGMVYGKGILMIEGGRWLARHRLLGVWKQPTWYHFISTDDFLEAAKNSVIKDNVTGIYHIGDNEPMYLQAFMDMLTEHWGCRKPWRLPVWIINLAASAVELYAKLFSTQSPLTRDFIKIGMVNFTGDTSRMKKDLLGTLKYPSVREGIVTL